MLHLKLNHLVGTDISISCQRKLQQDLYQIFTSRIMVKSVLIMIKNLMLNLQPFVESNVLDVSRVSEAVLASGSFDDDLYAMCIGLNSPALFYDKETVEAAGVTIPEQMTWDEFFDISQTIYDKTGVQTYIDSMVLGMLFRGIGTSEFSEDGTAFGVDDDSVFLTYFQMIADASKSNWHVSPEI